MVVETVVFTVIGSLTAIVVAGKFERHLQQKKLYVPTFTG